MIPQTIGCYKILSRIAVGGMAEIFLAEQMGNSLFAKKVAIKKILHHRSEDVDFVDMFVNEARLVSLLEHPGIVKIIELGQEQETLYLVMEYVQGFDLFSLLNQQIALQNTPFLPLPLVVHLMVQIAEALDYAHSFCNPRTGEFLALVHRDISLPNLMVNINGEAKILDFGIAKSRNQNTQNDTNTGILKGKVSYLSPEYLLGEKWDHRHDLFALGVVFYELLVGRKPFYGNTDLQTMQAIVQKQIESPSQFRNDLPQNLLQILNRTLEKNPEHRYHSAKGLKQDLENWLQMHVPHYEKMAIVEHLKILFPKHSFVDENAKTTEHPAKRPELIVAESLEPRSEEDSLDATIVFKKHPARPKRDSTDPNILPKVSIASDLKRELSPKPPEKQPSNTAQKKKKIPTFLWGIFAFAFFLGSLFLAEKIIRSSFSSLFSNPKEQQPLLDDAAVPQKETSFSPKKDKKKEVTQNNPANLKAFPSVSYTPPASERKLSLESTPRAWVYDGTQRLGKTPMEWSFRKKKVTLVLKQKKPFLDYPFSISLVAKNNQKEIIVGKATLAFSFENATLWLDGMILGKTPVPNIRVYAGFHTLVVKSSRWDLRKRFQIQEFSQTKLSLHNKEIYLQPF